jgi:hypothetical protein
VSAITAVVAVSFMIDINMLLSVVIDGPRADPSLGPRLSSPLKAFVTLM